MKKLACLVLFTAFVSGTPISDIYASDGPRFSATASKTSVSIEYNAHFEELNITMGSKGSRDKAEVFVLHNGEIVAKDIFVLSSSPSEYTIDLAGQPGGTYTVKIIAQSIKFADRFRKM